MRALHPDAALKLERIPSIPVLAVTGATPEALLGKATGDGSRCSP